MSMKKVLFIDRDGTLVIEPPVDYQLDSLEKLEFYPKVMRNLGFIRSKLDFEFAMVTNQDGLGTASFPEETFWPAHNLMMKTLEGEGITFDEIFIDPSLQNNIFLQFQRFSFLEFPLVVSCKQKNYCIMLSGSSGLFV